MPSENRARSHLLGAEGDFLTRNLREGTLSLFGLRLLARQGPRAELRRAVDVEMKGRFQSGRGLTLRQKVRGHVQTLRPFFARSLKPLSRPETRPWSWEFEDQDAGSITLTGRLLKRSESEAVIVLHGLGGSTESGYMALALRAAERVGRSCLLLNCRGADRRGADVYHSGLSADIEQTLKSPELASFRTIDILGYSIGGHIALRYASRTVDPRVRRVAAIGSPLDLRAAADDFDAAAFNVYRGHVLDALKEIYTAAYQRRPGGVSPVEARAIQKIRDWDEAIIAPRFGFQSADDYYAKESVAGRLDDLKVEALYVGATCDPMVRAESVEPYLQESSVRSFWDEQAGHLGFPEDFDMGEDAPRGLENQVLSWLSR